jgi:ATP-dependent DNA helicase RecQ
MKVIRSKVFRGNLHFEVIHTTDDLEKRKHLARLLGEVEGSKIIYTATVKSAEEIEKFLRGSGFDVGVYHGKLSGKERRETQDKFLSGEIETMIATNAFGMGVDKPDVRVVIHYQIPGNLEAYYQEAGRAGRDGEAARCILLYDVHDRRTQQFFLGGRYPKADDILAIYQVLQALKANDTTTSLVQIQETAIGVAKTKSRVALSLLKEMEIVRELRGAKYKLLKTDLTGAEIEEIAGQYEEKSEKDREKLEKMMLYAQNAGCRWQILSGYFEEEQETCGVCDNCINPIEERLDIATPAPLLSSNIEFPIETKAEIKLEKGEIVRLPKHGEAKVKEVNGENVTVVLEDGESKTFKKDFIQTS